MEVSVMSNLNWHSDWERDVSVRCTADDIFDPFSIQQQPRLTGEQLWQRDYDASHPGDTNPHAHVITHLVSRRDYGHEWRVTINGMFHTVGSLEGCLNLLGNPAPLYYRVVEI